MPEIATAGGTRFTPASSSVVKLTPACWLAAPSQAKTPASTPLTRRTATATSEPAAEPRRAGDRTDQEVVEPAPRLLGDRAAVSWPAADEGHQDGQDEEAHAEHGVGTGPGAPSFEKTFWTDDPEMVAPADLAMSP